MTFENDPIGAAIHGYEKQGAAENIIVSADLCEDDLLPVYYLFRSYEEMPALEQKALSLCHGRILDVGAAAGCHSLYLKEKGVDVESIDVSQGAVAYMQSIGLNARQSDFYQESSQYDTLLILMNGIGLAGSLERLPLFLTQVKKCLTPGGKAFCDSTDIRYMYEEEDGSLWVDLNGSYYGEMQFRMQYEDISNDWFPWLYIDFELLVEYAAKAGLNCKKILDGSNHDYLVELSHSDHA